MTQKDFIKIVKEKRISLNLTQKDFAKKIPISKTAYCKIENNLQGLNYFLIMRIGILLNIDLNIIKEALEDNHIYFD